MNKETEEKIRRLQLEEQRLQALLSQKQSLQMQLMELESALKGLEGTQEAYKLIGNVLIRTEKQVLEEELNTKKETVELRIKALDGQESKTRERAASIQKEVVEEMKHDSKRS